MSVSDATYFSVGDRAYFLGTVGLINSLRLTGHRGEIVILDGGFTSEQRELISHACTLMEPSQDYKGGPFRGYLKLLAPREHMSDIKIIIDSDMIVTGRLDELVDAAATGKLVTYADPNSDRWVSEWEELYGLPRAPRRDTYICSGVVVFSQRHYPELLEQWWAACHHTPRTDQDPLNAILMSMYPPGTVDLRPAEEAPQAHDLRVGVDITDKGGLSCSYRNQRTLLLHSANKPKPWIRLGARKNAYTALLRRLLAADDVPVRVPRDMIPLWLRTGRLSTVYLTSLHGYSNARRSISRRVQFVPQDIRTRISRILP